MRNSWQLADSPERARWRRENLEETAAAPTGKTAVTTSPHTTVYTQVLRHPGFRWIVRQLEFWNREPRARLTLRFDRFSSVSPEAIYVGFTMPCESILPRLSNGGVPFTPFEDQLAGTCRDYFAIDGWAHYQTPDGHWLWVSRDAPLIALGDHNTLAKRTDVPRNANRIFAMVFNNLWYTNFVGDSHGVMEFQFEMAWRKRLDGTAVGDLAELLVAEPPVMVNPKWKEDSIIIDRLYRP
jgi:hypothetical protein